MATAAKKERRSDMKLMAWEMILLRVLLTVAIVITLINWNFQWGGIIAFCGLLIYLVVYWFWWRRRKRRA